MDRGPAVVVAALRLARPRLRVAGRDLSRTEWDGTPIC
jgi:hypothetical protein